MHVTYERLWSWRVDYICRTSSVTSSLPSDQLSGEDQVGDDQITCAAFKRIVETVLADCRETQGDDLSNLVEGLKLREKGADCVSRAGLERASCKRMLELELWVDILREKHAKTLPKETNDVLKVLEKEFEREFTSSTIDLSSNTTVSMIKLLKNQIGNLKRMFPDTPIKVGRALEVFLEVDPQADAAAHSGMRQLISQSLGLDPAHGFGNQAEASTTNNDPHLEHCLYVAGGKDGGVQAKGLLGKFLQDSQGIDNVYQLLCEVWKGTGVPTPVAKMLLRQHLEGSVFANLLNFLTPLFSNCNTNNRSFWPEVKDAVAIVCSMESDLVPSLTSVLDSLPGQDRQKNFVSLMKKLQFLSDDGSLLRTSLPRLATMCEKFPGLAEILCKAKASKFLSFIYNLSDAMQEPRFVVSFHFHKEIFESRIMREIAKADDELKSLGSEELLEKAALEKLLKEKKEALSKLESEPGTSIQEEAFHGFFSVESGFFAVADLEQLVKDGLERGKTGVTQALATGAATLGWKDSEEEKTDGGAALEPEGADARAEGSVADDPEQELVHVWARKGDQADLLRCVAKVCCRHKQKLLEVLDVEQNAYKEKLLTDFWKEYLGLEEQQLAVARNLQVLQGILEKQSLRSESEERLAQLFWTRCERVGSVERGTLADALQFLELRGPRDAKQDDAEEIKRGSHDQGLEWAGFFAAAEAKEKDLQAQANLKHWILAAVDFAEAATLCFKPEAGQRWDARLAQYIAQNGSAPAAEELKSKFVESLTDAMREQACKLWERVQELKRGEQVKESFETDKFLENTPILMLGGVESFHQGLEAKIGFPHPNVMEMMRLEHRADYEFEVTNYGAKTTTPQAEWDLVMMEDTPATAEQAALRDPRVLRPLKHYQDLEVVKHAGLTREEVIAVRLYTGPMYVLYNAKLRGFGVPEHTLKKLEDGAYVTTLHAINSAILKLARVSKVPRDRVTYRGLKVQLPRSFWRRDARGCKGGVEMSFCSTTTKLSTAIHYADDGTHLPTIFEVRVGQIDFGACVQPLSQYPGEEEVLFPPLCNFEVRGRPYMAVKEGVEVLLVPLRVNVNMKALTVDELIARRQRHHVTMISHFVMESKRFIRESHRRVLPQLAATLSFKSSSPGAPAEEMPLEALLVKQLEQEQAQKARLPATHFNHDPSFRQFLDDAVELQQLTQRRIRLLRRVQKWGSKPWVQFVKPRRYLNYATLADEPVVWAQVTTQFTMRDWAAVLARAEDTFREDMSVVECEAAFQLMAVSKEEAAQVVSDRVGARARLEEGGRSHVVFLRKHSNVDEMETKQEAEDRHRNLISQLSQLYAAGLRFIADYHLLLNDFVTEGPRAFKRNRLKEYMVHTETISKELIFTPCTVQEVQAFLDAVETFPNKQPDPEAAASGGGRRSAAPLQHLLCTRCSDGVLCLLGPGHEAPRLSPDLAKLVAPRLAENKAIKEVRFGPLSLQCERFSEEAFAWTAAESEAISAADATSCTSLAILISELIRDKARLRSLDLLPLRFGAEAQVCLASALLTLPGLASFNGITVAIDAGQMQIMGLESSEHAVEAALGFQVAAVYTALVRETSKGLISVSEVVGQGTAASSLLNKALRPHEAAFVCMRVASQLATHLELPLAAPAADGTAREGGGEEHPPTLEGLAGCAAPRNKAWAVCIQGDALRRRCKLAFVAKECARLGGGLERLTVAAGAIVEEQDAQWLLNCPPLASLSPLAHLRVLVLSGNALGRQGCAQLAFALGSMQVEELGLGNCSLDDTACVALSIGLRVSASLKRLDLDNVIPRWSAPGRNTIGASGVDALIPALKHTTALEVLSLCGNKITPAAGLKLAKGVMHLEKLREINMTHNVIFALQFEMEWRMNQILSRGDSEQQGGEIRSSTPARAYVVFLPHMSKVAWETTSATVGAAADLVAGSQDETQTAPAVQPQHASDEILAGDAAI